MREQIENIKARLFIAASENGVREIGLGKRRSDNSARSRQKNEGALAQRWETAARRELNAYFAGRRRSFTAPCDLGGMPPFTRAVLRITAGIPYGEVRSYRWVAQRLGKPKAMRAVGNALAKNAIPIIIPCHRVVRGDGTLGGYALGLNWKRRLLDLEKSHPRARRQGRRICRGW